MKIVDMLWQICNDLDNPTGEQNWHYDQMKLILVLIIWYFMFWPLILIFPNLYKGVATRGYQFKPESEP